MKVSGILIGKNHSVFGNKGSLWNKAAHISADNRTNGRTLCGTPMLSTNHCREEDAGCVACIDIWRNEICAELLKNDRFKAAVNAQNNNAIREVLRANFLPSDVTFAADMITTAMCLEAN